MDELVVCISIHLVKVTCLVRVDMTIARPSDFLDLVLQVVLERVGAFSECNPPYHCKHVLFKPDRRGLTYQ